MDAAVIIALVGALAGGSGLGALAQARAQVRKLDAERRRLDAETAATGSAASVSGVEAAERALAMLERSFQMRLQAVEAQVREGTAREHLCAERLVELSAVVATHRRVLAVVVEGLDGVDMSAELKSAVLAARSILDETVTR